MQRQKATPRRVNFIVHQDDFACAIYGSLGFSTKYMQKLLPGLTKCQIGYRLSAAHVKRADYRDGGNSFSQLVIDEIQNENGSSFGELKNLIRKQLAKEANKQPQSKALQ